MVWRMLKLKCSLFNLALFSKCGCIHNTSFLPKTRFLCIGISTESKRPLEQNK
ncbi:Hypothetical predicted protein, partial [Paramuricea clavata]